MTQPDPATSAGDLHALSVEYQTVGADLVEDLYSVATSRVTQRSTPDVALYGCMNGTKWAGLIHSLLPRGARAASEGVWLGPVRADSRDPRRPDRIRGTLTLADHDRGAAVSEIPAPVEGEIRFGRARTTSVIESVKELVEALRAALRPLL